MDYADVLNNRVVKPGDADVTFAAKIFAQGGLPAVIRQEKAALEARKVVLSQMRIAPPEFPEGEEWMSVPEYTDRKMDVCEWRHRSGATFLERCHHPWGRMPWVRYAVCAPFFYETAPAGCDHVNVYYENSWYEYSFVEDNWEQACAFCLEVYRKLAAHGMDETSSRKGNSHGEWESYDYVKKEFRR